MRLSQLLASKENVSFDCIVPLLLHIYIEAHNWNPGDVVGSVFSRKREYIIQELLVNNIKNKKINGNCHYDPVIGYLNEHERDPRTGEYLWEIDMFESNVNIKELIHFMVNELGELDIVPEELLVVAGIDPPNMTTTKQTVMDKRTATELGTLRSEKAKWDASIKAAARIGIYFYEGELTKPTSKDELVEMFKDKVEGLHDTTVEMIYKALPSDYKRKGGRPKKDQVGQIGLVSESQLDVVIRAAVYAGVIYDTVDAKDAKRLKAVLADEGIEVPSETVMQKIIQYAREH